jgi:hypothetical protein
MSEEETKWSPPLLERGHRVVIAKTLVEMKKNERVVLGLVTGISGDVCDIVSFRPGSHTPKVWMACRHMDDPALELHPKWFQEDSFGVYRLAAPEAALERVRHEQASQAEMIAELGVKLAELEKKLPAVDHGANPFIPGPPKKRGPGRPRKEPVAS